MADFHSGVSPAEMFLGSGLQKFNNLAAYAGATVSRQISLAGRTVQIEVSTAMERAIMPALSHLVPTERREPDLTLYAWDSESAAKSSLSPGWGRENYRREGYISGFNDNRFHTALQFDPLIVRMLDMEQRCALYWTPSAAKLPHWEIGAPMRPLLHEWLKRIGMVAVHGGAVGRADGGLFLAGAGGRGKSNVALACLKSELLYASDDFCFLSRSPQWAVHSLYCTGKLAASDMVRHPHLHGAESNTARLDHEKALFFLSERFSNRLILEMPVRAVVLPRVVARGPSQLVPVSAFAAHKAIALSTIELSRWTGRDTLTKVAELLRDVPCYEVQVGASISDVPPLLADLLSDLR